MPQDTKIRRLDQRPLQEALSTRGQSFVPGVTFDELIKYFFAASAILSILVLGLIMLSLYRESIGFNPNNGFFGQSYRNQLVYREAGLEYVDILKQETDDFDKINKYLSATRLTEFKNILAKDTAAGKSEDDALADANAQLADFDAYAAGISGLSDELSGIASTLGDTVKSTRDQVKDIEDRKAEKALYLSKRLTDRANQVVIPSVDLEAAVKPLRDAFPQIQAANVKLTQALQDVLAKPATFQDQNLAAMVDRSLKPKFNVFIAEIPKIETKLQNWDPNTPIPWYGPATEFFFGTTWQTASFWHDYFGIIPLFVGSLLISIVALIVAIPLGVGAGVYVNQIATPWEQHLIKPAIEFISAIPSVVLGFFGVTVLGQTIRWLSDPLSEGNKVTDQGIFNDFWNDLGGMIAPLAHWVNCPIAERLNVINAGILLGFMAIPTIFTLTEDAINNVPRAFKEASFALGANRLQTIWRIIIPASLSGIISAVLLGFGRVIGETMVVLLCAGNRIAIPDFWKDGLSVIFQPVHTMTGIIAQELGEVENGSIHWHALFMVGLLLFTISLAVNFLAQQVVKRFKISIG